MNWELFFMGVSAASTVLIVVQLLLSHLHKHKEHEEQRRQKTVDMLLEWTKSLERETSFAEKIVEKFSEEQCRKLYLQEPFQVDLETKKSLCQICCYKDEERCKNCKKQQVGPFYTVDDKQLLELRWYIISYLNTLETVLVAWQQGTVDKKIIEREFSYLYSAEKGWDVLAAFRRAAGGMASYPIIETFLSALKEDEKRKNKLKIKYNL